ncbi:MAG: hypothetical protein DIZ78_15500 [endosymbiont of Escarpia spicata]|uniref:PQ-loop repeat-containing protein n=1 Tax=endosymbiont of Escarpia spicata TaxID=2200908 RepID=A0A370DCG0_9GAMM|nr:MAG: hypothetical protein DIZ78_15500 [endosymbiont of Escarpia spicata]
MVDLVGYTAGFFLMWSFLPQIIKTAKTQKTDGLSVGMLIISLISAALSELYAFMLGLTPMLIMNGIFLLLLLIQLVMTLLIDRSSANIEIAVES